MPDAIVKYINIHIFVSIIPFINVSSVAAARCT